MDIPSSKNTEFKHSKRLEFPPPAADKRGAVQFEPPARHKRRRPTISFPGSWIKRLLIGLAILAIAGLAYGYIHTKNQLTNLSNPKTAGQTETQQLVNKIGKLVALPSAETPTPGTVQDADKLRKQSAFNQVFFADAQNGDKVLIYSKAGKAVLYRPSTNKVIAYSRVSINGSP